MIVPGAGSLAETMTTWVAGPAMNATVPATSARPVADVSLKLTLTVSDLVSVTVTVTDPVPSGIEIDPGTTPANPVTPTVAV